MSAPRSNVATTSGSLWNLNIIALLALFFATPSAIAETYTWNDVPRIVAISDPHGAYDAMVQTLEHADVIDAEGHWSGADSHLVITGDLMDRGADSRKIMDLVMQLEEQAPASGGMVHLLLGNHEVMNLVGDLRYVAPGEYAAFAADELPEDRERWFKLYSEEQFAKGETDEASIRAAFDRDRPPGFFGHRRAFAADGYYGEWLLSKPLVVVVNRNAFVHGGLPPLVTELGLDALNDTLRADVARYVAQLEVLHEGGIFDPTLSFYKHSQQASSLLAMATDSAAIEQALQTIIDLSGSNVHSPAGPLWYRGDVGCSTLIEGDRLAAALQATGAERVIIGHTPTITRGVLSRHDGRVIEIDTGMLNAAYKGSGHALIIEGDEFWVASEKTPDLKRVVRHPRRVGYRPGNLSDENLTQLLASGDIVSSSLDASKRKIVEVSGNGVKVSAVFAKDASRKGLNPELAAYRLDLLLNLEMVPVTVAREVDGTKGALQYLPTNLSDEQARASSGSGSDAWCPLVDQWNAMYLFDVLVYNPGRPPTNMLYNLENWQMVLPGFSNTFGTSKGRPAYLENAPLHLTDEWRKKLTELDEAHLFETMGEALDKRRIDALMSRRDGLLEGS